MMKQQAKQKENHRCQDRHVHPHNKTVEHVLCKKCDAQVLLVDGNKCICCGSKVSFKDHKSIRQEQRILNHFLTAYDPLIIWHEKVNPKLSDPIILQSKIGNWIYQVDLKWILKYLNAWDCGNIKDAIREIKPHIHKIDFEISWGRSKVVSAD